MVVQVALEVMQPQPLVALEVLGQHPQLPDHLLHGPVAVEEESGASKAILREREALEEAALEAMVFLPLEQARLTLVAEVVAGASKVP